MVVTGVARSEMPSSQGVSCCETFTSPDVSFQSGATSTFPGLGLCLLFSSSGHTGLLTFPMAVTMIRDSMLASQCKPLCYTRHSASCFVLQWMQSSSLTKLASMADKGEFRDQWIRSGWGWSVLYKGQRDGGCGMVRRGLVRAPHAPDPCARGARHHLTIRCLERHYASGKFVMFTNATRNNCSTGQAATRPDLAELGILNGILSSVIRNEPAQTTAYKITSVNGIEDHDCRAPGPKPV